MRNNLRRWVYGAWLTLILSAIGVLVHLYPATAVEPNGSTELTTNTVKIEVTKSQDSVKQTTEEPAGTIDRACALIEHGKFDEAGRLIEASGEGQQKEGLAVQLKGMVEQWDRLQKQRQTQKEAAYKEELAKFERLKADPPQGEVSPKADKSPDGNDANDVNEPNSPAVILAAVVRTSEFADENQKKALMTDPCVLDAISRAKAEAAELESRGKWLDSYIVCYSWLAAMEPNNKQWTDYADRLVEKAEIAASFQDSPCETSKQRFEGVKRRIFERAVDALNFNYINKIDYRGMAAKGVKRCKSLAEVVGVLTSKSPEPNQAEPNSPLLSESFKNFRPDANAIAAFCTGLASLEQDINNWPEGAGKDQLLSAFGKMLGINLTTAHLPEAVLIAQFADASFAVLDPYTVIVWPTNVADFEKAMTNEFSGIGIEISREKGQLKVGSLLPDTPAYNSGLLDAGDVLEKVEGTPTKDMPIQCAVNRIMGPPGTKVTLTIRREGELQGREITLTRAKITVPSIRGWQRTMQGNWQYIVDEREKIGYVRIMSFSEKTASDLSNVLTGLEASGIRGLILDLRFNSGGLFDSAVEVSDDFLSEGLIVITRPRFGMPEYKEAHKKGTHPDYPLVVLINPGSASASEIVAGALADQSQKRATLVGERTHGKGVVQGITHYPGEGAQLKYTMAYYHLPSGQRVKSRDEAEKEGTKDWGIGPDVTVELRSDELRKWYDIQQDNGVLASAGHNETAAPVKRHTLEQTIEADPQLAAALLVIKTKLINEQVRAAKTQIPIAESARGG